MLLPPPGFNPPGGSEAALPLATEQDEGEGGLRRLQPQSLPALLGLRSRPSISQSIWLQRAE